MNCVFLQTLRTNLLLLLVGVALLAAPHSVVAQFNPEINYQGKLTNGSGVAVPDGTYNMNFWLVPTSGGATSTAVWSEARTGANVVQVTDGLFSVMLGEVSTLGAVDFNQTLYLAVEIGGTGTPAWDGEMLPRKVLGAVPAAFVAETADNALALGGVASSSFLRSDEVDTMTASSSSSLLTLVQNGIGKILSLFSGATEVFTVLNNGNVGVGTTTPSSDLTVVGDAFVTGAFRDSTNAAGTDGYVLQTTGAGTEWVATSSLGFPAGISTFLGLTDTPSSFTANRIMFTNSGGTALTDTSTFVFDGTNLGIGINAPSANLHVNSGAGAGDAEVRTSWTDTTAEGGLMFYQGSNFYGGVEVFGSSFATTTYRNSLMLTAARSDLGSIIFRTMTSGAYQERMMITNGGSVGIGTTTPSSKLSVIGDIYATGAFRDSTNAAGTAGRILQTTGTGTQWVATSSLGITGVSTFLGLTDTPSSFTANRIMFTNSGGTALTDTSTFVFDGTNLGIGTTTPASNLHVHTNAGNSLIRTSWTDTTAEGGLIFYEGSNYRGGVEVMGSAFATSLWRNALLLTAATNDLGSIIFRTRTSNAYVERMIVTNDGNVGIGTTTPSSKLSVIGDIYATGAFRDSTNSAGTNGMVLRTSGTGSSWVATSTLGLSASFTTSAQLAALLSDEQGTGAAVFANSPTFTGTPVLPSSFTMGSDTFGRVGAHSLLFVTSGITSVTLPTSGTLYGTAAGSITSAQLLGSLSNETGTGVAVFNDSPTIAGTLAGASATFSGTLGVTGTSTLATTTITDVTLAGAFRDSTNSAGTSGYVLQTNGTSTEWVATSSLGFSSGASTFLALTDTPSSFTANRIMFTNTGATALTDSADLTYDGTNLGLGGTNGIAFGGTRYITASTTNDSITFGEFAGETFSSSTIYNVAIGFEAGRYASTTGTNYNNLIGWRAGLNSSGIRNNIFGQQAGQSNTGSDNNFFGARAGYVNTGSNNNFFGLFSGNNNTSGSYNNFFGARAGELNYDGSYNNIFGEYAGRYNTSGSYNNILGYRAGYFSAGSYNILLGAESMYGSGVASTSRSNNVAIGYRTGYNATTGANNNILIGHGAADTLTTGANNIVIGYDVDIASTTGSNQLNIGNLIFGTDINGTSTTLSTGNVGIGTVTPDSKLTVAGDINISSTSVGYKIGGNTILYAFNSSTFTGNGAGRLLSSGSSNTANGYQALYTATSSNDNTAVGTHSLHFNTAGYSNTANGSYSLYNNSEGFLNTATGYQSLINNTTGSNNTAIGAYSLELNTTGANNTANGMSALYSNTTGSFNTALGYLAGRYLTDSTSDASTTDYSLFLGYGTEALTADDQNTIVIGYNANGLGSNTVVLGNDSIVTTALKGDVGIGTTTPSSKLTIAGDIFATGALRDSTNSAGTAGMVLQTTGTGTEWVATSSLGISGGASTFLALTDTPSSFTANRIMFTNSGGTALTDTANFVFDGTNLGVGTTTPNNLIQVYDLIEFNNAQFRTQLGYQAGKNLVSGATQNTFVGYEAGYASSTGSTSGADYNTAIGYQSLYSNTSGHRNTATGLQTLYNNTTGHRNTANGNGALYSNTTGYQNTANGASALQNNTTGYQNTANGYLALYNNTTGDSNTANGAVALQNNTIGINNTALGYNAGGYFGSGTSANASSSNSLYLGYNSRAGANGNTNEISIGYEALGIGSNTVVLGNDSIVTTALKGDVGIGTTTPSSKLTIAGDIFATGALRDSTNSAGTAGMVLQTTGTGTEWVATSSLGFSSGVSTFLALTDTPSSFTANRIMFTNSGGTALTDTANFVFDGTNLGVGTTTPNNLIQVYDLIEFNNAQFRTQLGYQAGKNLVSGAVNNTFVGYQAGYSSSTGSTSGADYNTAIGYSAFLSNTSGNSNVAVGAGSLQNNTTGSSNNAVGVNSLYSNTTGASNVAFGLDALRSNISGWYNIAIGQAALYTNTDSWYNTAIGYEALRFNTTGQSNTAVGYNALRSNTSGQNNIANGYETLYSNTSGSANVALGNLALRANTTGDYNVAIGYEAGRYLTDGTSAASTTDRSIFLGNNAKALTSNDLNSIVIGYNANGLGSNTVVLGNDSITTTALKGNVGIGTTTPSSKLTVAGDIALTNNLNLLQTTGSSVGVVTVEGTRFIHGYTVDDTYGENNFFGRGAGNFTLGSSTDPFLGINNLGVGNSALTSLTTGSANTAVGQLSLSSLTDAYGNTALGSYSLSSNTTGDSNTAVGESAMWQNTTGQRNSAFGSAALSANTTGESNVAFGYRALQNNQTGSENVAIGYQSLGEIVSTGNNTAVGHFALLSATSSNNTAMGSYTGQDVTSGEGNTMIGNYTGLGITTGSYNTILGANVTGLSAALSNNIIIADGQGNQRINVDSTGNVGIGTTTPSSKLTVVGDTYISGGLTLTGVLTDSANSAGTFGMVLQTTGTTTQWVATSTLGITGGASTFLALTDTPSSFTANRIMFTNSGATALTDSANLTYDGTNLGLGGTNGIAFNGTRYITASTTNGSITFGVNAGATITSGATNNIAIGLEAGRYASTTAADNNVYIGNFAGQNNNDNYNVIIGDTAGQWNTGDNSVLIGTAAGVYNSGISNNIVGDWAGLNNTGDYNNIMGWESGLNNTGSYAFLAGYEAGQDNDGNDVILIGHQAGMVNTGDDNIFLGDIAGKNNTNGFGNSFIGYMSGFRNTTGDYNLMLGWQSGEGINGDNNITLGQDAFNGNGVSAFTASNNIAIGYAAGFNADTNANNNILIGYAAADNLTSGANNLVIGYDIDLPSATGNNQLNIGNLIFGTSIDGTGTTLSTGKIGIGTSTLSSKFTIQGTAGSNIFTIASSTGTSLLTVNQSGYLGIGTTSPAYPLDVYLGTANAIRVKSDDAYSLVIFEDNTTSAGQVAAGALGNDFQILTGGTDRLTVLQAGNVGIGTSSPAQKLQVIGDIRVGTTGTNGCVQRFDGTAIAGTCSSDEQLKTDITPLSNSTTTRNYLEGMTSLTPVTYKWNEVAAELYKNGTTTTSIGLIAQDIELVFPELVSLDDKGYRQVNFNAFTFYIMQAMKEFYSDFLVLKDTVAGFTDLFISKEIQTEKLCVEGVCITAAELSELLQGTSGGGPASTPAAGTPPTDDQGEEAGGEEVTAPPEDGGAETGTTTDSGTEPEPDMTTSAPSEVVEEPPASAEPEPEVVEEPAEPEPEPEPEPVAEPPAPTEPEPGPEIGG